MDEIQRRLNLINPNANQSSNFNTLSLIPRLLPITQSSASFNSPLQNIEYIFNLINTSGTGEITAEELLIFLNNIDSTINLADVNALIIKYDTNGDSTLNFSEFSNIIGTEITNDKLIEAFAAITTDGVVDINKFTDYYNLLQINPIYRHNNNQYINIILRMIGNTENEFIQFWNYINTQVNG